jgi:AcrR family transcriptional regulator
MDEPVGLRERKKQRTREAISTTAIALFARHGFDQVSITQIADAAEVSRRTLFAYFPTKEDLVVARFADHEEEAGRVVRQRPPGRSPLAALREHHLARLAAHDPATGVSDRPEVLDLYRLLIGTPALAMRMTAYRANGERALAEALHETAELSETTARLAAAQIAGVLRTMSMTNYERAANGIPPETALPTARAEAEQAFTLLGSGLDALFS